VRDEFDDIIDAYGERFPKPPLVEPPATATTTAKRTRRGSRDQFIIVPMAWKNRLAAAVHVSTFKLALHLLYQHWKNDGAAIKLSNVALANDGISRWQKWRALEELEKLGLVAIERQCRRSPMVQIVKAVGNHAAQTHK
jgi:hypothetical protein